MEAPTGHIESEEAWAVFGGMVGVGWLQIENAAQGRRLSIIERFREEGYIDGPKPLCQGFPRYSRPHGRGQEPGSR